MKKNVLLYGFLISVFQEHHAFFMKTMSDVPDYLFVFRGNPRIDFKFDGYSFDP